MLKYLALIILVVFFCSAKAQPTYLFHEQTKFNEDDSLRGTLNEFRKNYDVLLYDIYIKPDFNSKRIRGVTKIKIKTLSFAQTLQFDLQRPLEIESITIDNRLVKFIQYHDIFRIILEQPLTKNKIFEIGITYKGKVKVANRPPWDGGWIWAKDSLGRNWASVACQNLGASVWYPCKDHQSDEPDSGAILRIDVPKNLTAIGNGRLVNIIDSPNSHIYVWKVTSPINNYNIVPYIGYYVNFTDTFNSKKGVLDLSYWVLDYHLLAAKHQFKDVKRMLQAFTYWFGDYPFYDDSYKLVDAPHLGMEHQSNIAYGNQFINGYKGYDLSETGWGLLWDYIIIHESGHEWFGNSITTNDIADMWVHEGFTYYSEVLFIEYFYGYEAGQDYCYGSRKSINNDYSIIGPYNVNKEGSKDMYSKGANLINTIRNSINNTELFRQILLGIQTKYYHKTVNTADIENYFIEKTNLPLQGVFDQYLRTTKIPVLEIKKIPISDNISFMFKDVVSNFNLNIWLPNNDKPLMVGENKIVVSYPNANLNELKKYLERKYYIKVE